MFESDMNRRDVVFGLAGAAVTAWLASQAAEIHAVAAYAASVRGQKRNEFFTADQARDFDAIAAQIIPTDATPGAREAHVLHFADRFVATVARDWQPGLQMDFKLLGDAVGQKTGGSRLFALLNNADQIALLTQFEKSQRDAFDDFRDLVMLGMFSHPMHGGNVDRIGWKLIGYEDRYSWQPPFGDYDHA